MYQTFFKNTQDLEQVLKTNKSFTFEQILPDLAFAEKKYIRPVISEKYFDKLLQLLNQDESKLTKPEEILVQKIRLSAANLAYYHYTPKGNVQMSSAGLKQAHSENSKPAFQWAVNDFKNAFRDRGFEELELLLEYLESNSRDYPEWWNSSACTVLMNTLLHSTFQFDSIVNIAGSRLLFLALKPSIKYVEQFTITGLIGEQLYLQLIKEVKEEQTTSKHKELIHLLQHIIAHHAFEDALTSLAIRISPEGHFVASTNNTQTIDAKEHTPTERISKIQSQHRLKADTYINKVYRLLNESATTEFPLYWQWKKQNAQSQKSSGNRFDNAKANGIFVL